jgi:hypothetical protein
MNVELNKGLRAYYKFDGNCNDLVAGNNGTNSVFTTGKIGQCLLSGNSTQISYSSYMNITNQFTFSVWYKRSTSTNFNIILSRPSGLTGNVFYGIYDSYPNSNTITLYADYYSGVNPTSVGQISLTDNEWHHFIWTYDGVTLNKYKDGSLVTAATITFSFLSGGSNVLSIGAYGNGGFSSVITQGNIDEFGFWDRAINFNEVRSLYNFGSGLTYPFYTIEKFYYHNRQDSLLTHNLVGYWKFDGNSNDVLNNYNGTNTDITFSSGFINQGVEFNGTTSHIIFPEIDLGTIYSISWWMSPTVWDGEPIGGSVTPNKYVSYLYSNFIAHTPDSVLASVALSVGVNWTNVFKHCTIIRNNLEVKLYVDGSLTDTKYLANNLSLAVARFGRESNGSSYYYNGKLDEVGMWNRTLTEKEVLELYLHGTGKTYPFYQTLKNPLLNDKLVAYYNFDGNSNDIFNQNNGLETGITYSAGRIGQSALFSGGNSCILLGGDMPFLSGADKFTFSFWYYANSVQHLQRIGGKWGYLSSGGFFVTQKSFTPNFFGLYFFINNSNGDTGANVTSTSDILVINNWYHITLVYDGTQSTNQTRAKIYINGVNSTNGELGTIASSLPVSTYPLNLGQLLNVNNIPADCRIDEVGLWSKSLSQSEVNDLYLNGLGKSYPFYNTVSNSTLENSVLAYYRLDGNSNDQTNTYNGTDINIIYSAGTIGQSASFDGTSSYITVSGNPWSADLTLALWIKVNDYGSTNPAISGKQIIFKAPDTGYVQDYSVSISDSISGNKFISFIFGNNSLQYHGLSYTIPGSYYDWMHVVCTRSAGVSKIFVNGVLVSIGSYSFTPINNGHTLYLGNNPTAVFQRFDGLLDEVGIWSRVLTTSEILELYSTGSGKSYPFYKTFQEPNLKNGLISYYKLDGNSKDSLGVNNGTSYNITYNTGKLGSGAVLNGSNSYIITTENNTLPTGYSAQTLSCWFKTTANGTFQFLVASGADDTQGGRMCMYIDGSGYLRCNFFNIDYSSSVNVGDGVWHFAAFVFEGNTTNIKLYIDNKSVEIGTISPAIVPYLRAGYFLIGSDNYSIPSYVLNGTIDEIGIWNRALEDYEVKALYNNNLGLTYPFEYRSTVLSSGVVDVNVNNSTLLDGLYCYYPLEGNGNDSIGNINGDSQNVSYSTSFGKINSGASFNGSTSGVVVYQPLSNYAGTINVWFYPTVSGITQSIFANGAGDLYFEIVGGNTLQVRYFDTSYRVVSYYFVLNTWQMATVTWDSKNLKLYYNGKFVDYISATPISSVANNFAIGRNGGANTSNFNGYIDEVGVWRRSLSANEIANLYNNGIGTTYPFKEQNQYSLINKLVSYWKLDGNSTDSYGSNTGIDTNVTYIPEKIVRSAKFNGDGKIQVSTGITSPFRQSEAITYALWVKLSSPNYIVLGTATAGGHGSGGLYISNGFMSFTWTPTSPAVDCEYSTVVSIPNDTWTFVVFTIDFLGVTSGKFYINGVLQTTSISYTPTNGVPDTVYNTANGDCIGARYVNGFIPNFNGGYSIGEIDEVGIWSRVLTKLEISKLYNSGYGIQYPFQRILKQQSDNLNSNLVSYWSFENNLIDVVNNYNGINNGANYSAGKVNQGLIFNGGGYIDDVGTVSSFSFMQNTGVFTLNFWLKLDDYTQVPQYFMGSSPTTVQKGFYIGVGATGNFEFTLLNGISSSFIYIIGTSKVITDNNWHMYSLVGDGSSCRLYKDSFLRDFVYISAPLSTGDSYDTLNFGRINNFGLYYLQGKLDEVGIWNVDLSQKELTQLYNNYSGLAYPLSNFYENSLTNELVSFWSLDENINDSVGLNNGLSATNINYLAGKIGKAAYFNGVDSKISLPTDSMDLNSEFTISAWVNLSSLPAFSDVRGIFGNYIYPPLTDGTGYYLGMYQSKFYFLNEIYPSTPVVVYSATVPDIDIWYHIVAIRSTSGVSMYVNGTLENETTSSGTMDYSGGSHYPRIGCGRRISGVDDAFWHGLIDEIGIWNRTLTSNEINKLYRGGSQYPFTKKIFKSF